MPVLTFSRNFPKGHPRAGQPTYFVEKIWHSLQKFTTRFDLVTLNPDKEEIINEIYDSFKRYQNTPPKHHTIRAGHRWKVGDKFSPRIWSGKPYQSKQITIGPDIEVKQVFKFELKQIEAEICMFVNDNYIDDFTQRDLAQNDGLDLYEMLHWFKAHPKRITEWQTLFTGQIICWNENIKY